MNIVDIAEQVKNKEDFVNFLTLLLDDFNKKRNEWENCDLEEYISAMGRFLEDSREQSLNKIDFTPSWKLFAKIMITASVYE